MTILKQLIKDVQSVKELEELKLLIENRMKEFDSATDFYYGLFENNISNNFQTTQIKMTICDNSGDLISLEFGSKIDFKEWLEINKNYDLAICNIFPDRSFLLPTSTNEARLLFMDFLTNDLDKIKDRVKRFTSIEGNVTYLKTSNSYHMVCDSVMPIKQWEKHLGEFLLFNGTNKDQIVDYRWIAHSLKNGFSGLRINSAKKPKPKVVCKENVKGENKVIVPDTGFVYESGKRIESKHGKVVY